MSTFSSAPAFRDVLDLGIDILRKRFPLRRSRHKTYLGDFQVIISLFYMSILRTHGYRNVLQHMAQDLGEALGWDGHTPSASALTQARGHVHADSLQGLVSFLYDDSTTARANPTLAYQGRRLLGVDGTRIELPSDDRLRAAFHTNDHLRSERPMPPQAGLVLLEDIGCRLPVAYRISTKRPDERACLLEMIEYIRPRDVVIADRGFPSREVFRQIVGRDADFIIRLPKNGFLGVDTFIQSGQSDGILTIEMADKKQQKAGVTEVLTVRLVRDEHLDEDGQPRIIATSLLDVREHAHADICFLYAKRWNTETTYRELKIYAGLENLQARTKEGILQEIAAIIIFQTLLSRLEGELRADAKETVSARATTYVKRAKTKQTPEISVRTVQALESPYRFNRKLIATAVKYLLIHGINGDLVAAKRSLTISMDYLHRTKTKARPGRTASRMPVSANARQKSLRRRKEKSLKKTGK